LNDIKGLRGKVGAPQDNRLPKIKEKVLRRSGKKKNPMKACGRGLLGRKVLAENGKSSKRTELAGREGGNCKKKQVLAGDLKRGLKKSLKTLAVSKLYAIQREQGSGGGAGKEEPQMGVCDQAHKRRDCEKLGESNWKEKRL